MVRRLAAAGTVTLGKLNCDEFAMGSSNENSAYGAGAQPLGRDAHSGRLLGRQRGGGRGAACCRPRPAPTPAARSASRRRFCGITGIKPTYGRASRYGMIAFASSLDQAGPMARSAEDCALLLSAMCGPDAPTATPTSLD